MKATVRGSMLRPVIKRVQPSLPEWKLRAIEIGHAQARHDASSRVNKCPIPVAPSPPAVAVSSIVGLVLALALS